MTESEIIKESRTTLGHPVWVAMMRTRKTMQTEGKSETEILDFLTAYIAEQS